MVLSQARLQVSDDFGAIPYLGDRFFTQYLLSFDLRESLELRDGLTPFSLLVGFKLIISEQLLKEMNELCVKAHSLAPLSPKELEQKKKVSRACS